MFLCRPDTRRVFVDIGLGFHVEFTWSEALDFISVREARLTRFLFSSFQFVDIYLFIYFLKLFIIVYEDDKDLYD